MQNSKRCYQGLAFFGWEWDQYYGTLGYEVLEIRVAGGRLMTGTRQATASWDSDYAMTALEVSIYLFVFNLSPFIFYLLYEAYMYVCFV